MKMTFPNLSFGKGEWLLPFLILCVFLSIPDFSVAQSRIFQNALGNLENENNPGLKFPSSSTSINISWDWRDLFEEPEFFEEKSSIIQIGIGLLNTVDLKNKAAELDQVDVKPFIPALHLIYERQIWDNLGVGLSLGTQMWKVRVLDYQYRYYTGGLHAAYHFNVMEKLDPYLALGATYRRMALTNTDRNIAESKVTAHFILGARYYFSRFIGGHLEIGKNTTSWFKLGFSFYFS